MKLKLPNSLYSIDQLLAAAEELHDYGAALGKLRHKIPGAALPELSPLATELIELLPEAERVRETAVEELRQELERLSTAAPTVTLVLAGPASPHLKSELVAWLRTEVRPNILVNFHVNPEIAGGVVIRSTNRIYDCSFRTKLLDQPERFTKVLDRV